MARVAGRADQDARAKVFARVGQARRLPYSAERALRAHFLVRSSARARPASNALMRVACRSTAASSSRWLVSSFSRMARWLACKRSRVASISAQNSARLTASGLAGLGLASFFTRRNAEPIAPAMATQPSLEMDRAEGIGD